MRRRVLYIHGIDAIGGAERDLLAILTRLNRVEWEPHVACPPGGAFGAMLRGAGLPVYPLALPPWRKFFSLFVRRSAVAGLRELIVRLHPALIHVNDIWWVPHALQALAGLPTLVPTVGHVRQEIEPEKAPQYRLDRLDAVIAISRQVEQALVAGGVNARRVQTIYSGLPPTAQTALDGDREAVRRNLGLSNTEVLLGTVAHLFPRKGYEVMLRALPAIIRAIPTAHYVIVGTGDTDYVHTLKMLVDELKIADRVHFVGFQDPVRPFLAALDLYVHPALMEGFGIAVAEAMALGKAVVATSTGGLPEVVEHERTGLLVAPGDPEELSRAVLTLLGDPPRAAQMGFCGAARVRERFDLSRSVAAIETVYRTVLDSNQSG